MTVTSLKGSNLQPFLRLLKNNSIRKPPNFVPELNVGLCVSGGPDSMALAHLMKDVRGDNLGFHLRLTAFIVNHNARPGSEKEARTVSHWLRDLGIPTVIAQIEWPSAQPLELPDFESESRVLRYQLLAATALKHGIDHLFLGHHRDDQIETALMRLIRTPNPSLLAVQAMASSASIPCCEELRGARNQEPPVLPSHLFNTTQYPPFDILPRPRKGQVVVHGLRAGGIKIHRPLLAFAKADLIAVCQMNEIPYVSDKTNEDPTFTTRNSVRVLRRNFKLPVALQDQSILKLSERAREKASSIRERGTRFLQEFTLRSVDLCSGTLEVSIPNSFPQLVQRDPLAGANAIERLSSIVRPQHTSSNSHARSLAAPALVNGIVNTMLDTVSTKFARVAYTNVMFEVKERSPATNSLIWRVFRAPIATPVVDSLNSEFEMDSTSDVPSQHGVFSESILWDRRYWVRIQASHEAILSALRIRLYQNEDAKNINREPEFKSKLRLPMLLHQHAPGNIRWTLPVFTVGENIITFPTIYKEEFAQSAFSQAIHALGLNDGWLRWEVCYKVITEPLEEWAMKQESNTYKPRIFGKTTDKRASPSPLFRDSPPSRMPYLPRSPADSPGPS